MKYFRIIWKEGLLILLTAGCISFMIQHFGIRAPVEIERILYGIKLTIVSIATAAILFFNKFFYDDVKDWIKDHKIEYYPKIVNYYKVYFILFFAVAILISISLITDSYLLFIKRVPIINSISIGTFLTSILLLFLLMIFLFNRIFSELGKFESASKHHEAKQEKLVQQEVGKIEAYVMIKIESAKLKEVYDGIKSLIGNQLTSVSAMFGAYDLIVKIKTENENTLGEYITTILHKIKGVKETLTCVCFEPK